MKAGDTIYIAVIDQHGTPPLTKACTGPSARR
jgi:hypothetical protein